MTVDSLVKELRARGVTFRLDGEGGVRITTPRSSITTEEREYLRSHRVTLVGVLEREHRVLMARALATAQPSPAVAQPAPTFVERQMAESRAWEAAFQARRQAREEEEAAKPSSGVTPVTYGSSVTSVNHPAECQVFAGCFRIKYSR